MTRYVGKPCQRCGGTERYKKGACVACTLARNDLLEVKTRKAAWLRENYDPARQKRYHIKSRHKAGASFLARRRQRDNARYRNDPVYRSKCKFNATMRKRHVEKATPGWLTENDKERIKQYYDRAVFQTRREKQSYHVDHIFPLRGKDFCGLHVPWNLQLMSGTLNMKKRNSRPLNELGACRANAVY